MCSGTNVSIESCFKPPFSSLGNLFTAILSFALSAAGVAFFFLLVWGGLRYMMAQGDDKAVMSARRTLTSATIGLLIIVSALIIINIIFRVFGLTTTII